MGWSDWFFLLTVIFLGIQILNSRKVFAVCVIIEICLLILCSRMERKKYGSVFCSFVHGEIWGMIFFADGWGFIGMMRKPNNYLIIGIMGTILIALCYFGRFWLVKKRIRNGWYEKEKKKVSYSREIAASVAMLTIATLRICGKQIGSKMEGIVIMRHVRLWLCCFFQLQFFHLCGLMQVWCITISENMNRLIKSRNILFW